MQTRTVKQLFLSPFEHLLYLFFPRICAACHHSLFTNEEVVCTSCQYHLPKTNTHQIPDNIIEQTFWGRADIKAAAAFLYFKKKGKVQKLIHQLKYKNREEIGIWLGKHYGQYLCKQTPYADADMIVPVPLHPAKQRRRGYNQSEVFALGLSEKMGIPVVKDALARQSDNKSQTGFSRYLRWQNTQDIFCLNKYDQLRHKHILLVDDVITTGATLEACAKLLNDAEVASVCIATIAYTN